MTSFGSIDSVLGPSARGHEKWGDDVMLIETQLSHHGDVPDGETRAAPSQSMDTFREVLS